MTKRSTPALFVFAFLLALVGALGSTKGAAEGPRPNILLIILDDQNAFARRSDLAPEPVSPSLARLAQRGVTFANAQCAAPVCNPSRTALLSGLRPSTTGIYDNSQDSLPPGHVLLRSTSLPTYFRERGYTTAGGGKIFGSAFGSALKHRLWDEAPDRDPRPGGRKHDPLPPEELRPLSGLAGKHDWGPSPARRDELEDWKLAGWAQAFLKRSQPKPFFLACGIVKPHTPWYVPREYFDLFPPGRIAIADLASDESAGVPAVAREKRPRNHAELVARRRELVAAYLAASRYADDCFGRILEGLDSGPHRDNTIVVVCGDNGYEFGEKNHWSKGSLREGSAHVPLVIAGPNIPAGRTSSRPVSLLDLYPTLLELAGLPAKSRLDGVSLVPLLRNPEAPWHRPALTTAGFRNHALRTERWRYIRYADGSEELFDHDRDPLERINLAATPEFAGVKAELQTQLPRTDEPRNPNSQARKSDD
jgi:arylsulfatase A-like enzyme